MVEYIPLTSHTTRHHHHSNGLTLVFDLDQTLYTKQRSLQQHIRNRLYTSLYARYGWSHDTSHAVYTQMSIKYGLGFKGFVKEYGMDRKWYDELIGCDFMDVLSVDDRLNACMNEIHTIYSNGNDNIDNTDNEDGNIDNTNNSNNNSTTTDNNEDGSTDNGSTIINNTIISSISTISNTIISTVSSTASNGIQYFVFTNAPDYYARRVLSCIRTPHIDKVFYTAYFDGEIVCKPDMRAYEVVKEYCTGTVHFFDDKAINVEAGRRMGWKCHLVDDDLCDMLSGLFLH